MRLRICTAAAAAAADCCEDGRGPEELPPPPPLLLLLSPPERPPPPPPPLTRSRCCDVSRPFAFTSAKVVRMSLRFTVISYLQQSRRDMHGLPSAADERTGGTALLTTRSRLQ